MNFVILVTYCLLRYVFHLPANFIENVPVTMNEEQIGGKTPVDHTFSRGLIIIIIFS